MTHVTAAFSQTFYRYRNDDGSETTATWKEAQNTNITADVSSSNFPLRLRLTTQETAGGSTNNADITIQYQINGGAWTTIDAASAGVRLIASAFVATGTATTNQIGGTGTFVPGEVISEAITGNISFAGNDHTENEWVMEVVAADLNDGETISFRQLIDGATMTYSVTPTIVVSKSASAPTVTTGAITSVTQTSANVAGEVTSDGGATITERGVAYNTTGTPTTADTTVTAAGTTGAYDVDLTSLSPNTQYFVRAYAINSGGTSYGAQDDFTTNTPPPANNRVRVRRRSMSLVFGVD